jgi:multidrug efflux pump subunit AcrB/ABC-type multidrug transport system ATPase subunit
VVTRTVQRLRYLGGVEDEAGRTTLMLDGRPGGLLSIGDIRVAADRPVMLRHVAEVEMGAGREEYMFRVNGKPSVGLVVFQEEGANLVSLGRQLRKRLDQLRDEFQPYGIDFVVGFDAAETVQEQLDRLKRLALTGFGVALLVLFLFLREIRAVAVVAVAVPVSLLAAVAMLFVGGWTLNLITLFGLAVGIGMLVDNSIVVYEAVQRRLERGADADGAAEAGIRNTFRAILAASVTNAVVFLPVALAVEDTLVRNILKLIAVAILLPLAASLLVAVGLVPLLARRLAAPAALARIERRSHRREAWAGLVKPDRGRELFSGVLKVALRRPGGWLVGVTAAVLFTIIVAVPWVLVSTATQEPPEADEVRLTVEVAGGDSLEAIGDVFDRLEGAVMDLEGVDAVESFFGEDGGSITVRLDDAERRPEGLTAGRIRSVVRDAATGLKGVEVRDESQGGKGGGSDSRGQSGVFGEGPAEVVLSGPEARQLNRLAEEIEARLESIPEVGRHGAWIAGRPGQEEIRVMPDSTALAAYGLTADQVLPMLRVLRREGVEIEAGFTLADGREIPVVVRIPEEDSKHARRLIEGLRVPTARGVYPIGALASIRRMPPPPAILHHNGRREVSVFYRLGSGAPQTGPSRIALDEEIQDAVREIHRPTGYTVEVMGEEQATSWFKKILVPILLLLCAVLAVTFESLTLPVLVLLAVPLTVLGATWALLFAGMPAGMMALVGVVALLGLTVNPAILLVDRMQHRVLSGAWTSGAAALAAVRERARPVLMTSCTTIAGLWPLALSTGREMEIWPPFATVVMGGLATSTLLTLLVIPAGFVLLSALDLTFGRLGPWLVMGWLAATAAVMTPLIVTEQITSLTWQVVTTLLVGGVLLGAAVLSLRRTDPPEPVTDGGPPAVEVRFLSKVYGRPGPVGRALRLGEDFAARVFARGGVPFSSGEARERAAVLAVVLSGVGYLALNLQTMFWRVVFSFLAAAIIGRILVEIRRARGRCDDLGEVLPGGPENLLAAVAPWLVLAILVIRHTLLPYLADERVRLPPVAVILLTLILVLVQSGRNTAIRVADGAIPERVDDGFGRRTRTVWRRVSRRLFGAGLRREEVEALATVHFRAEGGMVGILGPNGAGKTTLLRLLAGILEPSGGTINLGGVRLEKIRRHLARWVGYLPQDFGLPDDLTAREYLEYYALMYNIGDGTERTERVGRLLEEVGLGDRADDRIGGYSGGMRQRVAVARTLLRLPAVIIVDEPTVGLDPRERIRFRNLLARLADGRVVLFSTHVVEDVAVACERVVVLARGEVVYDGEPGRLAGEAQGRAWEARLDPGALAELPDDALVVDRVPEADGSSRVRILCSTPPHRDATPVDPTLEDGYLSLVGTRENKKAS